MLVSENSAISSAVGCTIPKKPCLIFGNQICSLFVFQKVPISRTMSSIKRKSTLRGAFSFYMFCELGEKDGGHEGVRVVVEEIFSRKLSVTDPCREDTK
jgi:hypothetical protein